MDRYQRVEKPRHIQEPINENDIRITAQGLIRNYVTYATTLLEFQGWKMWTLQYKEKGATEIVLKAMGQAISKTVAIAEIIKKQKRIPGLYQETSISSMSITDVWEPIEEGLETLEINRQVSLITIALSTAELDKNSPGYQAPSDVEQPEAEPLYEQQPKQSHPPVTSSNEDSYGRGRGHGGGRGRRRGRGRGGYGNNSEYVDYYNYNWVRGGGRDRGWGYRGAGYERGRGGGRGYGHARGWIAGRGRGGRNQA